MRVSGTTSQREREYLFVDGGCLRAAVREVCRSRFGDVNAFQPHVPALATGSFDKIFYYDAISGRAHNETLPAYEDRVQPELERFASIQALDRVHVALGQIVGADRRQKGVDVRLAVDLMTHAFRGNISRATLFAGDADFVPLIKALVSEGLHVTLWHPPQANSDLKGAADSTRLFDFRTDHSCFTADGQGSAFRVASAGGAITPGSHREFREINGRMFTGSWERDTLNVWRSEDEGWSFVQLEAPGADLQTALTAFDLITPWQIAGTGAHWIELKL